MKVRKFTHILLCNSFLFNVVYRKNHAEYGAILANDILKNKD